MLLYDVAYIALRLDYGHVDTTIRTVNKNGAFVTYSIYCSAVISFAVLAALEHGPL